METSPLEFHKSITDEIKALQNRVRSLIGNANWGYEGMYKEAILRNMIKHFLPSNISLGTGFVIDKKDDDELVKSTQIDIIAYNNTYPTLFSEGDFIITTPENVVGIIEVKTRIRNGEFQSIVSKASENGRIIGKGKFNGIFSFEGFDEGIYNRRNNKLEESLKISRGIVNHLSIGQDVFIKFWSVFSTEPGVRGHEFYSIYEITDYSYTYFISNLVEYTSKDRLRERWWFQYPIREGKENYKKTDVPI